MIATRAGSRLVQPTGYRPSSLVRRRKLRDAMPGVLDALLCRADAADLRDAGLRRKLLAGRARELGFRAPAASIAAAEQAWLGSLGVRARDRDAFLAASGLAMSLQAR